MGALKTLPEQGTGCCDAWACFWPESMLITCMMTSSNCMMSHNLGGSRIGTVFYADRILRVDTSSLGPRWTYRASMVARLHQLSASCIVGQALDALNDLVKLSLLHKTLQEHNTTL